MKVELGAPVVLRLDEPDVWHLPKDSKPSLRHVEIVIDDAMRGPAASWPALCDHAAGDLFVYDGFVRRRRLCRGCAFLNQQEPHQVPASELEAIADYDRRRALEPDLDEELAA